MPYSAVVVAAGLSSRMKAFKPLLEIGGVPMIELTIGNLKAAGVDDIVVVLGYRAEELASALGGIGVRTAMNYRFASTSMFESVCLGLRALPATCEGAFITPGDVPFAQPELIRTLMSTEGDIVKPAYRGKLGHPVLIRRHVIPSILPYNGDGGLGAAFKASNYEQVLVEARDEATLLDADTPQDFERLVRFAASRGRSSDGFAYL